VQPLPIPLQQQQIEQSLFNCPVDVLDKRVNDKSKQVCAICMEYKIRTVIVECGHSYMCISCAKKTAAQKNGHFCAICLKPISRIITVFTN